VYSVAPIQPHVPWRCGIVYSRFPCPRFTATTSLWCLTFESCQHSCRQFFCSVPTGLFATVLHFNSAVYFRFVFQCSDHPIKLWIHCRFTSLHLHCISRFPLLLENLFKLLQTTLSIPLCWLINVQRNIQGPNHSSTLKLEAICSAKRRAVSEIYDITVQKTILIIINQIFACQIQRNKPENVLLRAVSGVCSVTVCYTCECRQIWFSSR
jgi:hypothetical protein